MQPVIDDDLKKPGYVRRVEIIKALLSWEPLPVRNVERIGGHHDASMTCSKFIIPLTLFRCRI